MVLTHSPSSQGWAPSVLITTCFYPCVEVFGCLVFVYIMCFGGGESF